MGYKIFMARLQEVMFILQKTLVLVCFDYFFLLWSPHSVKLTVDLEVVQSYSTKKTITEQ